MRNKINYFGWIILFVFGFYSCQQKDDTLDNDNHQKTIQEAKLWYNINSSSTNKLKYTVEEVTQNGVSFSPEWTQTTVFEDEDCEIVETEITTLGRISLMDDATYERYMATKDIRYKQSFSRYVFLKNKKEKMTVGFIMTFMPDLEYVESSRFKTFENNNYLYRDETFSGLVLYYNLDGKFANGWKYKMGKVVGTIEPITEEGVNAIKKSNLKTYHCQESYSWEIVETCYYYYTEAGGYTSAITQGECRYEVGTPIMYNSCIETGDGGYFPGGAITPRKPIEKPELDCSTNSTKNSATAESALNSPDTKVKMDSLRNLAKTNNEYSGLINKGLGLFGKEYTVPAFDKGDFFSVTGGAHSSTIYMLHTHTAEVGNFSNSPSPADLWVLMKYAYDYSSKGNNTLQGSIIFTTEGHEYLIAVDDRQKLVAAGSSKVQLFETDDNTGLLINGSMQDKYDTHIRNFVNQGYNQRDADMAALICILNEKGMGITIARKDNKNQTFNQKVIKKENGNYKLKGC